MDNSKGKLTDKQIEFCFGSNYEDEYPDEKILLQMDMAEFEKLMEENIKEKNPKIKQHIFEIFQIKKKEVIELDKEWN